MNNKEKAREIMETFTEVYGVNIERDSHIYSACMQMAEWKEQQYAKERKELIAKANQAVNDSHESGAQFMKERLIEKAVNWLLNNATEHIGFNSISESFSLSWDFIDLFKQAMEE